MFSFFNVIIMIYLFFRQTQQTIKNKITYRKNKKRHQIYTGFMNIRLHSIGKSGFQILQSKANSENRFHL